MSKTFLKRKRIICTQKKWRKTEKSEEREKKISSHGTFKFTIGCCCCCCCCFAITIQYISTKNQAKRDELRKEGKKTKKIFYLNLPSKMLPELMKKIRTKCIGLYYVPAIIFVIVIRLAYEGHSFDSCIPFWLCSVYLEWILLHICTLGTGIQPRICTSELRTITHIPRHPNDLLLSFVFHSVFSSSCEYSFFTLKKYKKTKEVCWFSSFTVHKSDKKTHTHEEKCL